MQARKTEYLKLLLEIIIGLETTPSYLFVKKKQLTNFFTDMHSILLTPISINLRSWVFLVPFIALESLEDSFFENK